MIFGDYRLELVDATNKQPFKGKRGTLWVTFVASPVCISLPDKCRASIRLGRVLCRGRAR